MKIKNEIPELISDEDFNKLTGLFDLKAMRNYVINRDYKALRPTKTASEAYLILAKQHGLLEDTVRKIINQLN